MSVSKHSVDNENLAKIVLSHLVSQLCMLTARGDKKTVHALRKWCVSRHGRGYHQPI